MKSHVTLLDSLLAFYVRRQWRGRRSLLRLLRGEKGPALITVRTKHGLRLNVDPLNYMDRFIVEDGYYEEEVLQALDSYMGRGRVLWDIGANIGLHAITAKHLHPTSSVVCFEPAPYTFFQLYSNCLLNNVRLDLLNVALSDTAGYGDLSLSVRGNHGQTSLKPWPHGDYEYKMLCRCETGYWLVENRVVSPPNVIKIDVEGYELEVLRGLGNVLDNIGLKAIIFEDQSHALSPKDNPLRAFLSSKGFNITPIESIRKSDDGAPTNFIASQ